jgi:hypothetical protein
MGKQHPFGEKLGDGGVGPIKTASNPTPRDAAPPIQLDRWYRVGRHPDANAANDLAIAATQGALYRPKQVFCSPCRLINAGVTGPIRWRFSFRTGAYHHALLVAAVVLPNSGILALYNHSAKLSIYSDTAEATLVVSETFSRGSNPHGTAWSGSSMDWADVRPITKLVTGLSPDTAYYAKWEDVDYGILQSASVVDLQSLTENNDGYPAANHTAMSPVVDDVRRNIASMVSSLWKKNAAHLLNWTVDDGTGAPVTITSSTATNIVDGSSTSVSAATPGFYLDLTDCDRLSQASTGVPCVMKVFAKWTKNASPNAAGGTILLKDSGGATVASITDGWSSATPVWVSVSFNMDAVNDKYDITYNSDAGGGSFAVYAISIYMYE